MTRLSADSHSTEEVPYDPATSAHARRHANPQFSGQHREAYIQQVSLFARHFKKSPELLGPEQIRAYQVYLTTEKKLAPGSILIAVSALRFLYKVTLKKTWLLPDIIPAPKKPQTLPVILSPEEVMQFLGAVESRKHRA